MQSADGARDDVTVLGIAGDWTVETARSLGLTGWVRNVPDGTVEAHVEGEETALGRMIEAMHDGPPRAAVDRIDQRDAPAEGFDRFERR